MTELSYHAIPEQTLFLDLPETDLKLKAILRGTLDGPVVVMMHGRPGTGNDLLHYLGSRYLYEQGISTLRLFMYSFEENTRNLVDCTLQTHVDDFTSVVNYLRQRGVPQVLAIGHSYGGITIVKSQTPLDGAVLWDPSHGLAWQNPDRMEQRHQRVFDELVIGTLGKGEIVSKVMNDQDVALGDTTNWAEHIDYPLAIISAGGGILKDLATQYASAAKGPVKTVEIANASHSFNDSDESMLKLFAETTTALKEVIHD